MTDENFKNAPGNGFTNIAGNAPRTVYAQVEHQTWVTGSLMTPSGIVPAVKTVLEFSDRLGGWKARWAISRMNYKIPPGIYAVGSPTDSSPVFVSANYKMSFDRLRANLDSIDGWILVLDTKGINVWCAAGKGTFGTSELVLRIGLTGLDKIVSHRKIIVPQLGAPGVAAHLVKKQTGFKVIYGPVRAVDIKEFLAKDMKADKAMRQVRFDFADRMTIVPTDLILSSKYAFITAAILLIFSGLGEGIYSVSQAFSAGLINALIILAVYILATVLPVALLPYLPGRSFSAKGGWVGVILSAALIYYFSGIMPNRLILLSWILIIVAISSYIAMNFTGASTYTSLSGVRKEMKVAVPVQIIFAAGGLILFITGQFI